MTLKLNPNLNHDLMVRTLAAIVRDPASYNQAAWAKTTACGTTYCVAGHAVMQEGYRFPALVNAECGYYVSLAFIGPLETAPTVARRKLGLHPKQAESLFDHRNTLDDVFRKFSELSGLDETVLREKVQEAAA